MIFKASTFINIEFSDNHTFLSLREYTICAVVFLPKGTIQITYALKYRNAAGASQLTLCDTLLIIYLPSSSPMYLK